MVTESICRSKCRRSKMSAEQMSPEQMSRSICRGAFVVFFGAIDGGALCRRSRCRGTNNYTCDGSLKSLLHSMQVRHYRKAMVTSYAQLGKFGWSASLIRESACKAQRAEEPKNAEPRRSWRISQSETFLGEGIRSCNTCTQTIITRAMFMRVWKLEESLTLDASSPCTL